MKVTPTNAAMIFRMITRTSSREIQTGKALHMKIDGAADAVSRDIFINNAEPLCATCADQGGISLFYAKFTPIKNQ